MAIQNTLSQVEALYIGYFGRAGEPDGVQYWVNQLNSGSYSWAEAAASFSVQPEATAMYPYLKNPVLANPSAFVDQVYMNLFNRAPDAEGKAYWVNQLLQRGNDPQAVGQFILDVISGAFGAGGDPADAATITNKIEAGTYFTQQLADAGIGGTHTEAGKVVLDDNLKGPSQDAVKGVTDDSTTVDASKAGTDAFIANPVGEAFVLTVHDDIADTQGSSHGPVPSTFKFTNYSEVVEGNNFTLGWGDYLADGSTTDNDQLNVTVNGRIDEISYAAVQNIEHINITANGAYGDFEMASYSGVKTLNISGTTDVGSTLYIEDIRFSGVSEIHAAGLVGRIDIDDEYANQSILVETGASDDYVRLGNGNNKISTGAGDDAIRVGNGDNVIDAGAGNNNVSAGNGNNSIRAGDGNDDIFVGDGDNTINAGNGINTILAGNGANIITSGSGADSIAAGHGDNVINAGAGANNVIVGNGSNSITTGADDDNVAAGNGNNTINAGGGNNNVAVGNGNNHITSGIGNDKIVAGNGDNVIDAGGGANDIVVGDGNNSITTGAGIDLIKVGSATNGAGSSNTIHAGDGDNVIEILGDSDNTITTGAGWDTITLDGNGNSTVSTGDGKDTIKIYGNGDNTVDAGDGLDTIEVYGTGANTVLGGDGVDVILVAASATGANKIAGGLQQDYITLQNGSKAELIFNAGDSLVTFGDWDSVTGFKSGDHTLNFNGAVGSATNYGEEDGSAYFANYNDVLAAANAAFLLDLDLSYYFVSDDTNGGGYLFYSNGSGEADSAVWLAGLKLADLGYADIVGVA